MSAGRSVCRANAEPLVSLLEKNFPSRIGPEPMQSVPLGSPVSKTDVGSAAQLLPGRQRTPDGRRRLASNRMCDRSDFGGPPHRSYLTWADAPTGMEGRPGELPKSVVTWVPVRPGCEL